MALGHTQDDELLPIGEAARILGVSVETLRRYSREGMVASIFTPGGHRRFRRSDVLALAEGQPASDGAA